MPADLYARLFNTPLYSTELYAQIVTTVLASRLNVQAPMAVADIPATRPAAMPMITQSGVMILPIVGGLVHRGGYIDAMSGAQSYTNVQNMIVEGLQSERVKAILLDIDSPGGEVGGCFGLADEIYKARSIKPIWGIANDRGCSAAYMLLASCKKVYATESSHTGSIGVVWQHVDISQMLKSAGIVTTLIYAGAHKTDGNPYEKLSKEVRADFQAGVDQAYTMFVDAVVKRRPLDAAAVRATEARVYRGEDAKGLKLIDGVLSFDAVLDRLEASLKSPAVPGTTLEQPATPTDVVHFDEDEDAMSKFTQEQMDAATTAARTEAHAAGVKEGKAEGYTAGRADAGAIFGDAAAKGKPAMAAELAGDPAITKDRAVKLLATAAAETPAVQPSRLDKAMRGSEQEVGAEGGELTGDEKEAARRASLRDTMKGLQASR